MPRTARHASVSLGVLVAMLVLGLVITALVHVGGRHQRLLGDQTEGLRAFYAMEGVANMATKETFDAADLDGDGGVGTISNDNSTSDDPSIGGVRVWAEGTQGSSITAILPRGHATQARRAAQVLVAGPGGGAATILLLVVDSGSLTTEELARKSLMESWGYTVTALSATATQAQYDAAVKVSSVAYIVETCLSSDVGTKLTGATIGVITEESALSDEFGFSGSMTTLSTTQLDIVNTSHYITRTLSSGVLTVYTSSQPVRYLSGTQGGYTALAEQVSSSNVVMAVMERGALLTPSGTAAGRRVYLPFGNTYFNLNSLTTDGKTLMRRSIEWCLMPVAHWKLDEGTGSVAADEVSGYNATLVGSVWASGRLQSALSFDGYDDYIQVADHSSFHVTSALSVAGWIFANSWNYGDVTCIILRKGEDNPNNWELAVNDGRVTLSLDDYDRYGIKGNTTLTTSAWHHVAATWDGTTVKIYVDGVLDGSGSHASQIGTDSRPLYIGGRSGATDITNGDVDDVRFYNRPLTAGEVSALAAAGRRVTAWTSVQP